ncbi:hypothetical protein ACOME3_007589 [Neoechinorhynchus agilis]
MKLCILSLMTIVIVVSSALKCVVDRNVDGNKSNPFEHCDLLTREMVIEGFTFNKLPKYFTSPFKLKKLRLENGGKFFGQRVLTETKGLIDLRIVNMGVTKLRFIGKHENLEYLDISRNAISDVLLAKRIKEVKQIFAKDNNFTSLDGFRRLRKMRSLILSKNMISEVKIDCPKDFHDLRIISLFHNPIERLEINNQKRCRHLRTMKLSYGRVITDIFDQIKELPELSELYVRSAIVSPGTTLKPGNVRHLVITTSKMKHFPSFGENRLHSLTLEEGHISQIEQGDLVPLKDIEELILRNNRIREIEPDAFSGNCLFLKRLELTGQNDLISTDEWFRRLPKKIELVWNQN